MLTGTHVRLEPLDYRHVDGLVAASAGDPSLYQWSPVPQGKVEATSYIDTALAWLEKRFGELYKSEVARQETPIVAFRELRTCSLSPR